MAMNKRIKTPPRRQNICTGLALKKGGLLTLPVIWPTGKGLYKLDMTFHQALVHSAGSGAIGLGELKIIKNIKFDTGLDGLVIDLCGKELYYRAFDQIKTLPLKDTIAASTATYDVAIPIHFADNNLKRPENTLLDTLRYKDTPMSMQITMGDENDLLGTVGGDAVTLTVDIDAWYSENEVTNDPLLKPRALPFLFGKLVNPANDQFIELPKDREFAIKKLIVQVGNTATAGEAWSGTPSDTTIDNLNFEDDLGFPMRDTTFKSLKNIMKEKLQAETALTGIVQIDFIPDKDFNSSYLTGNRTKCQLNWDNVTLSTSQVNITVDGWKVLKPISK